MNVPRSFGVISRLRCLAAGAVLLLASGKALSATPGALDLGFAPTATDVITFPHATLIGDQVYLFSPVSKPIRLKENGRRDTSWNPTAVGNSVSDFVGLPAGGWLAVAQNGTFFDTGDGTVLRARNFSTFQLGDLFPQDDGSILIGSSRSRVRLEGDKDPRYGRNTASLAANFDDGAGSSSIGGSGVLTTTVDTVGRLYLGGNFRQIGPHKLLGLARLLRDGAVDLAWNPAPELGLQLNSSNYLSGRPISLSVGLSNSLLVGLQMVSTNGKPTHRYFSINEAGHVERSFPSFATDSDPDPVIQPDGRILVAGNFTQWGNKKVSGFIRLEPDGVVDSTFEVTFGEGGEFFTCLTLDRLGRALIGGSFKTVNGIARPGVARLYAFDPPTVPVSVTLSTARERIATNEVLYLSAKTTGFPPPELQWYHGDALIPGATNRALRLPVEAGTDLNGFRLKAQNGDGSTQLQFPAVHLAVRSPAPGGLDPRFHYTLTNFNGVTQLVPLSSGGVLVGAGRLGSPEISGPRVARLLPGGGLDPTFGQAGVVSGKGIVEQIVPLADGGLLVAGALTELDGSPIAGLAQLDREGHWVPRAFPELDIPHVSAVLPLSDGSLILAGLFTKVGQVAAFRLARLRPDLTLDPSFVSPLAAWQFVDALALDLRGRLLIAGERIYTDVVRTGASNLGLQRLRSDGSLDPQFHPVSGPVRTVFIEPNSTLLVDPPPRRLTEDGEVLVEFQYDGQQTGLRLNEAAFGPDHRTVRTDGGGVIFPVEPNLPSIKSQLLRFAGDGSQDFNFVRVIATNTFGTKVYAAAGLSDGSVILALENDGATATPGEPRTTSFIERLLPDGDLELSNPRISDTQFEADLATQPGKVYEARHRSALGFGLGDESVVETLIGDGYWTQVVAPLNGSSQFLRIRGK